MLIVKGAVPGSPGEVVMVRKTAAAEQSVAPVNETQAKTKKRK